MLFLPVGQERPIRKMPYVTISLVVLLCAIHIYTEAVVRGQTARFEKIQRSYDYVVDRIVKVYLDTHRREDVTYTDEDLLEYTLDLTRDLREKAVTAANEEALLAGRPELHQDWIRIRELYTHAQSGHLFLKFGFIPSEFQWYTVITSIFLHADIIHLFANIIFLWFAGINLEDRWGRFFFTVFFLAGGAAANWGHYTAHPESDMPAIGASGAVAALMGGIAARYPFMKTRVFWLWVGFTFRFGFITIPVYAGLAAWLAAQIVMSTLHIGNVAYAAHISGFGFGLAITLILMTTRIDRLLNRRQIEARDRAEFKTEYSLHPHLQKGMEHLSRNEFSTARRLFQKHIHHHPDSMEGRRCMALLAWKESNYPQAAFYLNQIIREILRDKSEDEPAALLAEFRDSELYSHLDVGMRIRIVERLVHQRGIDGDMLKELMPKAENLDPDERSKFSSLMDRMDQIRKS